MDSYVSNSYKPEKLVLSIDGSTGVSNEPFSCVKNLMDCNILILAYENPVDTTELSKALGIPMAFIEESVEKLVYAQLLKQQNGKVFTDFVIVSMEDMKKALETSKRFAHETFEKANEVFTKTVEKYKQKSGFSVMNDTQLYIMAVLSTTLSFMRNVGEKAGYQKLDFKDYPVRPNYGRWIVSASKRPGDFVYYKSEFSKYSISGMLSSSEINDTIKSLHEWDTPIGQTHGYQYKYHINERQRACIIDAVRTDSLNAFQAEFIPEFEKLGFIKTENGKKVPNVPYLTDEEEKQFFHLENAGGEALSKLILDEAAKVAIENKVKYPKRISYVPCSIYNYPLCYLQMCYVYEAAERGVITIEKDKNYPVIFFTKKQ